MTRPGRHAPLALTLWLLAGAAREAGAQRQDALSSGMRSVRVPATAPAPASPSTLKLTGITLAGALGAAAGGALIGYGVDSWACRRRHRGEDDAAWDCFLTTGTPTGVGWFGGGIVGATAAASVTAQRRGCSARAATWRALGGALLGATPGAIAVLGSNGYYPPGRSAVMLTAPLLSGAGATLAVVGCHR
jgi:hypothetical protein